MPESKRQKTAKSMRKAFGSEQSGEPSESMMERVRQLLWGGDDTEDLGSQITENVKSLQAQKRKKKK